MFDFFDAPFAVSFVDFLGKAREMPWRLQEDHHLADLFLLMPADLDLLDPLIRHALDFQESVGFFIDDFKGIDAELLDDPFGVGGADPFDHSRF